MFLAALLFVAYGSGLAEMVKDPDLPLTGRPRSSAYRCRLLWRPQHQPQAASLDDVMPGMVAGGDQLDQVLRRRHARLAGERRGAGGGGCGGATTGAALPLLLRMP